MIFKTPPTENIRKKPTTVGRKLPFTSRNHYNQRKVGVNKYEISETRSDENENFPSMLAVLKNEQGLERKFLSTLAAPASISFFNKINRIHLDLRS